MGSMWYCIIMLKIYQNILSVPCWIALQLLALLHHYPRLLTLLPLPCHLPFVFFLLAFPKKKKALSQNALAKSQKEKGKKQKKKDKKKEVTKEIKAGDQSSKDLIIGNISNESKKYSKIKEFKQSNHHYKRNE